MKKVSPEAVARAEAAKERARIFGTRFQPPSKLEQAAEEWKRIEERRLKERARAECELPIIPLSEVPLEVIARGEEDTETIWRIYKPPERKKRVIRLNAAAISALALSLRAKEWAQALRGLKRRTSASERLEENRFVCVEAQAKIFEKTLGKYKEV